MNKIKLTLMISLLASAFSASAQDIDEVSSDEDELLLASVGQMELQKMKLDSVVFSEGNLAVEEDTTFWNHYVVNPYKMDMLNMKDTVVADCSSFFPPLDNFYVTSKFGFRSGYRFHYGTDFRAVVGDTIRSAFDGKVRIAKYNKGGYGYYVLVRHPNGLETIYGHMSKILKYADTEVKAGEPIGLAGNTGRSSGPHLHFEVRYLGNPIDPMVMFDFEQKVPYEDYYAISAKNFEYKKEINKIRFHIVRSGDTLGAIARRYGTTVSRLQALNRMGKSTMIRPGQKLRYT